MINFILSGLAVVTGGGVVVRGIGVIRRVGRVTRVGADPALVPATTGENANRKRKNASKKSLKKPGSRSPNIWPVARRRNWLLWKLKPREKRSGAKRQRTPARPNWQTNRNYGPISMSATKNKPINSKRFPISTKFITFMSIFYRGNFLEKNVYLAGKFFNLSAWTLIAVYSGIIRRNFDVWTL